MSFPFVIFPVYTLPGWWNRCFHLLSTTKVTGIVDGSYRPVAQIPQYNRQTPHNASFRNRNVHMCSHFCHKMVHCGMLVALWDLCDRSINIPSVVLLEFAFRPPSLLWWHKSTIPSSANLHIMHAKAISDPYGPRIIHSGRFKTQSRGEVEISSDRAVD